MDKFEGKAKTMRSNQAIGANGSEVLLRTMVKQWD